VQRQQTRVDDVEENSHASAILSIPKDYIGSRVHPDMGVSQKRALEVEEAVVVVAAKSDENNKNNVGGSSDWGVGYDVALLVDSDFRDDMENVLCIVRVSVSVTVNVRQTFDEEENANANASENGNEVGNESETETGDASEVVNGSGDENVTEKRTVAWIFVDFATRADFFQQTLF
jgi:hypothetical protein